MHTNTAATQSTDVWLTLEEAAAYSKRSARTVRRWGDLKLVEIRCPAGGPALIRRESLEKFISSAPRRAPREKQVAAMRLARARRA